MHLLDVAQNALKAGAKLVEITVAADTAADTLHIQIKDDGCGMSPQQLQAVTDPFFTTRTTRKVGLGVPLFKMAAELSGGGLTIDSQQGRGTAVDAAFGLTHIDRMPLGNMADTMCILMGCNEQIHFSFTYQVGEKSFCVSTEQLQQVLDGVPLNTPQVMEFLRGYIKENMDLLSGGAS